MESKTINIYKAVPLTTINPSSFARGLSGAAATSAKKEAKFVALEIQSLNQIGKSLNGIAKTLDSIRQIELRKLKAERRKLREASFTPRYLKSEKLTGSIPSANFLFRGAPKFWEALLGFFGGLIKYLVLKPVLEWLADEKNQKAIVDTLKGLKAIFEFLSSLVTGAIGETVDGLYNLLKDDATPWERLTGFLKAFSIIGGAFVALKFLKNPKKTIDAFRNVLKNFNAGLTKRRDALKKGARPRSRSRIPVRKRSGGGYIDGPLSGYPVTLDGRGVDFIGHGREYVAQKPGGDAYVIPLDTPHTRQDPGLTNERIVQALKSGFNLSEMSQGGWINGPDSGYAASFTGARPEFIGHGLEYVARNRTGKPFVIPFNNPATRANPGLLPLSMAGASMMGYDLPKKLPGKPQFIFGSIGKALGGIGKSIGNFFGGGKKSSGGGGGGFLGGLGNIFNPPSYPKPGTYYNDNPGSPGGPGGGGFFGNLINSVSNIFGGSGKKGGQGTSGIGPVASGESYSAMIMGNKTFGYDYENGSVKGGLGGILKGLARQGGNLGVLIGDIFGSKQKGGAIGSFIQKVFGGGGSNKDGSANWWDVIRGAGGIAAQFTKGKTRNLIGKIAGIGDILMDPSKTFGDKIPALLDALGVGGNTGDILKSLAGAVGDMSGGMGAYNPSAGAPMGSPRSGGGIKKAIAIGKKALTRGLTAFNHPNFRNNKWNKSGPNTGIGYSSSGREATSGGANSMGLALDIMKFGANPRTALMSFAEQVYANRENNMITQLIYDKWGSWQEGGKRLSPGNYGMRNQIRVQVAGEADGDPLGGNTAGGMTQTQYSALRSAVEQNYGGGGIEEMSGVIRAVSNQIGLGGDFGGILKGMGYDPKKGAGEDKTGGLFDSAFKIATNDKAYTDLLYRQGFGKDGVDILKNATSFGKNAKTDVMNFGGLKFGTDGNDLFAKYKKRTEPQATDMGDMGSFAAQGSNTSLRLGNLMSSMGKGGDKGFGTTEILGNAKNLRFDQGSGMKGALKGTEGFGALMPFLGGAQGGEGGAPLAQGQDARKQRSAEEISKVTDQRMYARSQMNSRSQETVSQTIAAVEANNAQVRAQVAAAQSAVANIMAGQGSHGGQVTGSNGNMITQSIAKAGAMLMNSAFNGSKGGLFA